MSASQIYNHSNAKNNQHPGSMTRSSQSMQNLNNSLSSLPNPAHNHRRSPKEFSMKKKMVKVINGKMIPETHEIKSLPQLSGTSSSPKSENILPRLSSNQSAIVLSNKPNSELVKREQNNLEQAGNQKPNSHSSLHLPGETNSNPTSSNNQIESCSVLGKTQVENDVDSFINMNEVYYKHVKGVCICYKCTCGKHKCAFAKNSHLKQPFNLPPARSIYRINYIGKPGLQNVDFDYGMYEAMRSNAKPIDNTSINHKDYKKPGMDSYGANQNFKPNQVYEANPLEVGRSHYKRDFLEWGCVPYQPIKGYSQRTTIDAMPFHGATTYNKDYYKMNAPKVQVENKNHTTTMVKSPIPFLGITTHQDSFKPYRKPEQAIRYKASDELITGAPSYQGQYNTLHNKDYINFSNICPVEKDSKNGQAIIPFQQTIKV